jgi:hypothetical protein
VEQALSLEHLRAAPEATHPLAAGQISKQQHMLCDTLLTSIRMACLAVTNPAAFEGGSRGRLPTGHRSDKQPHVMCDTLLKDSPLSAWPAWQ